MNVKRAGSAAILIIFLLAAAACSSEQEAAHNRHVAENGDLQERTASLSELPTFLNGQDERIRLVYRLAGDNYDLLRRIPCYCGCGRSAGHQSNANCFIKEAGEDGSIVWDDHGTRCNFCLLIAAESAKLKRQGKSDKEIRDYIDEKYKEGFAEPTPTPMPS